MAKTIDTADRLGILHQIGRHRMTHRVSLYADDVVMFINPVETEIATVQSLLQVFGDATGLHANFSKSSVTPIHCNDVNIDGLAASLDCAVVHFPCRYLGMPLSDKRLRILNQHLTSCEAK
jgi:hypothetical protein